MIEYSKLSLKERSSFAGNNQWGKNYNESVSKDIGVIHKIRRLKIIEVRFYQTPLHSVERVFFVNDSVDSNRRRIRYEISIWKKNGSI